MPDYSCSILELLPIWDSAISFNGSMFSSIFEFVCSLFISSYEAVVLSWECLDAKSYDLQIISITRGPQKVYLNFVTET